MTIAVEIKESKKEIQIINDLVGFAYEIAMEFGRELVSRTLEAHDEELRKNRDRHRYRCKGK